MKELSGKMQGSCRLTIQEFGPAKHQRFIIKIRWEPDVRIKAEAHPFRVGIHSEREIVMGDLIFYPVPGSLV